MSEEKICVNLQPLSCFARRFLLENFYLDEHVRYIVTIYPVVLLWQTSTLSNFDSTESQIYTFAGTVSQHMVDLIFKFLNTLLMAVLNLVFLLSALLVAITVVLFVARIALVTWRHYKQPLYGSGATISPVEISLTQRKLFL